MMNRLHVIDEEKEIRIVGRQREVVLATLLARANQVVSVSALLAEVWGDRQPASAMAALHNHISHLRKLLRGSGRPGDPIVTTPVGYLIQVQQGDRDVDVFCDLLDRGREHAHNGHHHDAVKFLDSAFAMIRSVVTCSVDHGEILAALTVWLNEARLECFELLMESSLQIGKYREATGQLQWMLLEQPLRETLYQLLMLALCHSGRRAEALQVYRIAHSRLRTQLGIEPCGELQDLHQAILIGDIPAPPHAPNRHQLPEGGRGIPRPRECEQQANIRATVRCDRSAPPR